MSDTLPLSQMLAAPPRRDRRIGATAAVSFVLHVLVIGLLLLPALQGLQQPDPPPPINVELVPPTALPSDPPPSSEAPSSEPPPSHAPVSSEQPSMEPVSSGQEEPASSVAAASGASSAPAEGSSEAAAAASAPVEAPVPAPRPVVIPVAPDEASEVPSTEGDASDTSAASEAGTPSAEPAEASALTTTGPATDTVGLASSASEEPGASAEASSELPPPPKIDGALHVAKKFYLANMLQAPEMAAAREAIKKLPPQKRLVQTCNIEAIAQIGQASRSQPDAIVADAFAPTQPSGTTFTVPAGAFRSNGAWHAVSYDCTLSKDMSRVQSFSFRIGGEVALPSRAPAEVKRQGG
jgi:hypothetical protein